MLIIYHGEVEWREMVERIGITTTLALKSPRISACGSTLGASSNGMVVITCLPTTGFRPNVRWSRTFMMTGGMYSCSSGRS